MKPIFIGTAQKVTFACVCFALFTLNLPSHPEANATGSQQPAFLPVISIQVNTWMTSNLDIGHFLNGDPIPEVRSPEEWAKAGEEQRPAWCYYENDPENGKVYGRLYNWYAVTDPRGLAPKGWHIPTREELDILIRENGGAENVGKVLKHSRGWRDEGNGSGDSGFHALPAGNRGFTGGFSGQGENGYWWTSTPGTSLRIWILKISFDSPQVVIDRFQRNYGLSVRCVKD